MSALPMPLLDRALEELSHEDLILATRLARQTLADHLDDCRSEINNLTEKVRRLQDDLNEVSEERNKTKSALRTLKDKLDSYVVSLYWVRGTEVRSKLVTLGMILEDPGTFLDHRLCEVEGHGIHCEGGHETR